MTRPPIFDLTLPTAWPGTGYCGIDFAWSISLCPTCDLGVPLQVMDTGPAVIVQFCDACSSRLSVESEDGSITQVVDLDELPTWGEPFLPPVPEIDRSYPRSAEDRARETD